MARVERMGNKRQWRAEGGTQGDGRLGFYQEHGGWLSRYACNIGRDIAPRESAPHQEQKTRGQDVRGRGSQSQNKRCCFVRIPFWREMAVHWLKQQSLWEELRFQDPTGIQRASNVAGRSFSETEQAPRWPAPKRWESKPDVLSCEQIPALSFSFSEMG